MDSENTERKQRGRPFAPGQSGNPKGRPKGARNRATVAAEALLEGEAEALTRKAIDMALGGDVTALKLCLERLVPPRKDRTIAFEMPRPEDATQAFAALLAAIAEGRITIGEASAVAGLIETQRRACSPEVIPAPAPALNLQVNFVAPETAPRLSSR
jgi:hypothetical protein